MRVLHIMTPSRFSGAERVCCQLCEELAGRGHEALVLTRACPPVEAALRERDIAHEVAGVGNKFNPLVALGIATRARLWRADIIHTHHSTAAQWGSFGAKLAGIPCVAHAHAMSRALWMVEATRIIAVADAVKAHLIRQGRHADEITVIHNAVETEASAVDAAAVRASVGVPADAPLIAVAAHLSRKKGHHVLLRALARLLPGHPELQCVLMGDGPEREALQALAAELGLGGAVRLTGYRDDARDVMAAADLVALPSTGGEGTPLSLLEAAARATPIVATELAGVPELVADGETGLLVPPDDPEALAQALALLLDDPGLRRRMGAAARERVAREFSREARARAVERLYREALGEEPLVF